MNRRAFLSLGMGGLLAIPLAAEPRTRAARQSAPLAILTRPETRALLGRVASVGDLIPAGLSPRSNRDALPAARTRERVDAGLQALLGPEPWSRLFRPEDVVAIKINGLASGVLSPRREIVAAVIHGLRRAGVPAGQVIVWDRTTQELERSGFALQTGPQDVRVYGTDALRGGGYAESFETCGAVGSLLSRIVTHYATALINIGVLKDHDLAGLSAGMKNLYGAIHNPNRYHDSACDPYVAEVAALPSIRAKLRLTVIDAVLAQAEGGPAFAPDWIWPCNRILLAVDPVAADHRAGELLAAERARRGLPSLAAAGRAPTWIATAAYLGLGHDETTTVVDV